MTTRKDKQRKPKSSLKDDGKHDHRGHDHRIIALVRLLARKAAQRDYEDLLKEDISNEPKDSSE